MYVPGFTSSFMQNNAIQWSVSVSEVLLHNKLSSAFRAKTSNDKHLSSLGFCGAGI